MKEAIKVPLIDVQIVQVFDYRYLITKVQIGYL